MLFLPSRSCTPGAHCVSPRPSAMTSAGTELGPMCIVWPVMSLRVCMPCARMWLCSPSIGAAAANGVLPEAAWEKPLMGGGTSATLLMEFFSSPSDFSACCNLAQMRSQSYGWSVPPVFLAVAGVPLFPT